MSLYSFFFGHTHTPGSNYGVIRMEGSDGIGRHHAAIMMVCSACGKDYVICRVHPSIDIPKFKSTDDNVKDAIDFDKKVINSLRTHLVRSSMDRRRNLHASNLEAVKKIEAEGQAELQQLLNDFKGGFK